MTDRKEPRIPLDKKRAVISSIIYRHMIETRSLAQRRALSKQEFEDYIFATTDLLHNAADFLRDDDSLDSFSFTWMQDEANFWISRGGKAGKFAQFVCDEISRVFTEQRKNNGGE